MKSTELVLSALLGASVLGLGSAARAQQVECESDADCEHGYVCESGTTACPTIEILCVEDEACEQPACESEAYARCVVGPCEQDGDCPDDLVCASSTYQECDYPDVSCQDGEPCERPEPTDCREVTDRYCAAPWELPCQQDADCGDGFRCVERISMWCSGSEGSADGESAPEPAEPECGSEPTGEYYCEQQEIPCSDDAQCPELWSCMDNPLRPVCSGPAGGDGEEVSCGDDTQPERVCWPPSYERAGFGGIATAEATAQGGSVATADGAGMTEEAAAGDDDSASGAGDSGCRVGNTGDARGSGGLVWLVLALGVLLRRRRAAA